MRVDSIWVDLGQEEVGIQEESNRPIGWPLTSLLALFLHFSSGSACGLSAGVISDICTGPFFVIAKATSSHQFTLCIVRMISFELSVDFIKDLN